MTSHGPGFCGGCYAWQERRVGKDVLVWRPQMHSKKPTKLVICSVYPSQNEGQSFWITPKSNRSKPGNYIGWQRIGKTMAVRGWGCLKQTIEGISRQLHLWRPAACLNTGGVFAIGMLFCFCLRSQLWDIFKDISGIGKHSTSITRVCFQKKWHRLGWTHRFYKFNDLTLSIPFFPNFQCWFNLIYQHFNKKSNHLGHCNRAWRPWSCIGSFTSTWTALGRVWVIPGGSQDFKEPKEPPGEPPRNMFCRFALYHLLRNLRTCFVFKWWM